MDSIPYLDQDDGPETVTAWKQRFGDTPVDHQQEETEVPLDHCPVCRIPCVHCVTNNTVTCTNCGLVTSDRLLLNDVAHMSFDQMTHTQRTTIHFYNRYTYFKDYMQRLAATATCNIDPKDEASLRLTLTGYPVINPVTVEAAVRALKLTKKYLVHTVYIAQKLGGHTPVRIDGMEWYNLKKLFIRVSKYWRCHHKRLAPNRKSFLNYPYVFYQLVKNLGYNDDWTKDVKLPKHYRTILGQRRIWSRISRELDLQCFETR